MNSTDILTLRLHNEQLVQKSFTSPADVVKWLGAVQSQDYGGAKWALSLRLANFSDEEVEKAFTNGEVIRTHIMRPTWHFIHPEDLDWIQKLTSSRVKTILNHYNKQLGLTDEVFKKTDDIIKKALSGYNALTREEISGELGKHGINALGMKLGHIVIKAELDALICSGPRKPFGKAQGKQFTYMLAEERIKKRKDLTTEEALKELTKRYFQSHSPATVSDFSWWSGLTIADCKKGIALNSSLQKDVIEEKEFYVFPQAIAKGEPQLFLLPNYDEYTIAYKERFMFLPENVTLGLDSRENAIFQNAIVYEGKVIGFWKKTLKQNRIFIESKFFTKPNETIYEKYKEAAENYGKFFGLSAEIM